MLCLAILSLPDASICLIERFVLGSEAMGPITWYFRSDRITASSRQSQEESSILDISSDLEYPEPVFDFRLGRTYVIDWERLSSPVGRAEGIAYRAACQGSVTYDDLMHLVCSLPSFDLPSRPIFNIQDQQSHAFLTGACVHGGTAVTLSNLNIYPWTTCLFCSIARQQAPTFSLPL